MRDTGFFIAIRLYARVLAGVLAGIGFFSIIGLYAGWLALSEPRPAQPVEQGDDLAIETDKPFRAAGPVTVKSQIVPVDPRLTYEISAEVRSIAPQGMQHAAAITYLGVITYDQDGKEIRGGPGNYRYAGASKYPLYSRPGWSVLSGSIAGQGNETHHQFRPGTRFVRVVALLNYENTGTLVESGLMTTEIRNVRFSPRAEMKLN